MALVALRTCQFVDSNGVPMKNSENPLLSINAGKLAGRANGCRILSSYACPMNPRRQIIIKLRVVAKRRDVIWRGEDQAGDLVQFPRVQAPQCGRGFLLAFLLWIAFHSEVQTNEGVFS